ncbi:MAG: hypothetical protein A3F14_04210 [Gammaproteobacteria bacterium RIFCSPHIGHO2_12_FULL_43_28]|nr:MAG: hypothetical protein A3F14_04210 [Gammaproteobacteria bacterium RIFCSPHIGHO2_12_FULL_43_28]
MKFLNYAIITIALSGINLADAKELSAELSQANMKFYVQLNKGDTVHVKYDLTRYPIYRQYVWQYYAMFCYAHGKANIEYTNNTIQKLSKLPMLASKEEYDQTGIGKKMDEKGEFTIINVSEYDSGSVVDCALYPKFGE